MSDIIESRKKKALEFSETMTNVLEMFLNDMIERIEYGEFDEGLPRDLMVSEFIDFFVD